MGGHEQLGSGHVLVTGNGGGISSRIRLERYANVENDRVGCRGTRLLYPLVGSQPAPARGLMVEVKDMEEVKKLSALMRAIFKGIDLRVALGDNAAPYQSPTVRATAIAHRLLDNRTTMNSVICADIIMYCT